MSLKDAKATLDSICSQFEFLAPIKEDIYNRFKSRYLDNEDELELLGASIYLEALKYSKPISSNEISSWLGIDRIRYTKYFEDHKEILPNLNKRELLINNLTRRGTEIGLPEYMIMNIINKYNKKIDDIVKIRHNMFITGAGALLYLYLQSTKIKYSKEKIARFFNVSESTLSDAIKDVKKIVEM